LSNQPLLKKYSQSRKPRQPEETPQSEPVSDRPLVRMLHLSNGCFIVGYVVTQTPVFIGILRPYEIHYNYSQKHHEIIGYDLVPYLDQLNLGHPLAQSPIPFLTSNIISVMIPEYHVIRNYEKIISMKEMAFVAPDKSFNEYHENNQRVLN
jgi:hypothetical protein